MSDGGTILKGFPSEPPPAIEREEEPETSPREAREGFLIDGRYRVQRVLGRGGGGMVVEAFHAPLSQRVAIKFLARKLMKNPEMVARFENEARAAAQIRGEHVVDVRDVGRMEGNVPFMVMEYLEGVDVHERLQREGPLPIGEVVEIGLQVCEGLAEAHSIGIVHRDLKPSNIFLTKRADGTLCAKILDFGISKVQIDSIPDRTETEPGLVMGSPGYMSPEQMRSSRDVDGRTDIWSLGISLYEMLTNVSPFKADTYPELYAAILTEEPKPLRDLRAEIPEGVAAIVARCLAKQADERFANAAEVAQALSPFAPHEEARTSAQRAARLVKNAPAPLVSEPLVVPRASRRFVWIAAGVISTAAVAGIAAAIASSSSSSAQPEHAATAPAQAATTAAPGPSPTTTGAPAESAALPPVDVTSLPRARTAAVPPPPVPSPPPVVAPRPAPPAATTEHPEFGGRK